MDSVEYENRALHFAEIGMYAAAQVFATLALVSVTRSRSVEGRDGVYKVFTPAPHTSEQLRDGV